MVATLTILGALMAVSAGGAYFTMPKSIEIMLPKFVNLDKNGMVYPMFVAPPFALKSRYYVFEIVNKKQVMQGAKPKLGVRGPIHFTTTIYRDNVTFYNDGQQMNADAHRKLVLNEEASEDLDMKLWMFNPIVVGVADQVKGMVIDRVPFKRLVEPIVFNSVNIFLDRFSERAIVHRTPRELLEGTKIDMLEFLTNLANQFGLGALVPPGPPNNIFGIAYVQNETVDNSEIWTGVGATQSRFAEVISWHGHKTLPYWKGKCNRIEGTNGELYKPFIKPGKPIKIFLGQTCRSLWLDPVGDMVTLANGMYAYQYSLSQRNFQAPVNNGANDCYCFDPTALECKYDGLIRLAPCFFDAPILFARPNMTGADNRLRGTIQGELVNGTKLPTHQSFWLDPVSSTPLKVDMTFMAVLKIPRTNYMRDLDKMQPLTYMPLFAATEALEIPDSLSWQLKYLQKMYMEHKGYCVVGVLIGIITAVFGLMLPQKTKPANKNQNNNKNDDDRDDQERGKPTIDDVEYTEPRKAKSRRFPDDFMSQPNDSLGGNAASLRRQNDLPGSGYSDQQSVRTISTKLGSSDESTTEQTLRASSNKNSMRNSRISPRNSTRRRMSQEDRDIERD